MYKVIETDTINTHEHKTKFVLYYAVFSSDKTYNIATYRRSGLEKCKGKENKMVENHFPKFA